MNTDHLAALVATRRKRVGLEAQIKELTDVINASVEHLDNKLAEVTEARARAVESHPLARNRDLLLDCLAQESSLETSLVLEVRDSWDVAEKSIRVPGGLVTRSTRLGVEVTDSEALARELLERRLWAYVKGLTVDAKGLRPLVDAGGVAGLAASDAYSIAVKLEAE